MSQTLLSPLRVHAGAEAAIVFIHGFGGNPQKTWGLFPDWLAADSRLSGWDTYSVGYTTRLVPDIVGIWSADAPLSSLSLLLKTALTEQPLGKYRSLCLIAHSMGGLITQRALLDHSDLAARVSHIFLFGTPSAGLTKAGPFSFLKRQVRDMGENSDFVRDVRQRWTASFGGACPFRFCTVAGDQDEFVPAVSSLEPFPLPQREVVVGNHVSIVKPARADDLAVKLVIRGILGEAAPAGAASAARVAVESREFFKTIQLLGPNQDDLDAKALVDLALALEETGRQAEAIALLEKYGDADTDAMGVLAGRLKRRWLAGRRRSDAERALHLYKSALQAAVEKSDHAQAFYHAINVAFMELAFGSDHGAATEMARSALDHCGRAPAGFWRLATEADALMILGETDQALDRYSEAVAARPEPRQLKSMYQQALRLADLLNEEEASAHLNSLWRGEEAAAAA